MANNNEVGRARVELDTASAEAKVKSLEAKMQELKQTKKELEASGNLVGMGMIDREIKSTQKDLNQLRQQTKDYSSVLNNLSTASLRNMEAAYAQLRKEVKGATRDTEDYKDKTAQLQTLGTEIKKVRAEQAGVEKPGMWGRMADGVNKYAGMIAVAAASFTGFALGVKGAIEAANDYEEKVANLSALTGLTGKDLNWLSDQAKEMSTSTVNGNIRITKSADDIVDAFTTVGSKRPELLGNKDALKQVTEQALILAEAGKMETAPAIEAVTASMNQFNLGADQSTRIINTLAAGSLAGSAEVSDLAGSMKNVGTVAKDSNMSLEETTAALEVLASKQILGEEAGTKLRGSLLKMKEAGVGYASGQFNLRDAIDEVNAKLAAHSSQLEKDAILQKTFGAENITVGSILLQNKDAYDELTKAVTGTNTVLEQAHTNTDIDKAKLAQSKNEFHNTAIEIGEKLNPAMAKSVNIVNLLLRAIVEAPAFFIKYAGTITALTIVIVALTVAVNAQVIAEKAKIIWDKLVVFWNEQMVTSFQKLWATLLANPFTALLAVGALLIGFLIDLNRRTNDAADAQSKLREEIEKTKKTIQGLEQKGGVIDSMNGRQLDDYIAEVTAQINALEDSKTKFLSAVKAETNKKIAEINAGPEVQKEYRTRELAHNLDAQLKEKTGFDNAELTGKIKELKDLIAKAEERKKTLPSAKTSNTVDDDAYSKAITKAARDADLERIKAKENRLAGQLNEKKYKVESDRIDQNEFETKLAIQKRFGKDTVDTQKLILDRKISLQEEAYNASIKGSSDEADALRLTAKESRLAGLLDEKKYNEELKTIDLAEDEAQKAIMIKFGKDTTNIDKQIYDKRLQIQEDTFKDQLDKQKIGYDEIENQLKLDRLNGILTEEKYQDKLLSLTVARLMAEIAARKKAGKDTISLESQLFDAQLKIAQSAADKQRKLQERGYKDQENYIQRIGQYSSSSFDAISQVLENQLALNNKKLEDGNMTQQEYEDANKTATEESWQNRYSLVMNYTDQISGLVENSMNGNIKSFKEFGAQMMLMTLDMIEKELEATMYASVAKAAMGSIASGHSIATWGITGLAEAAALTLLMKAAFSGAKALINKSVGGYAEGGYTPPGPKYKPVGIVHAGEWVASQRLLRNPIAAGMISHLNAIQERGYANGGYVTASNTQPQTTSSDAELKAILTANARVMAHLSNKIENIQAKINYTHLKTELDKMGKVESTRKIG